MTQQTIAEMKKEMNRFMREQNSPFDLQMVVLAAECEIESLGFKLKEWPDVRRAAAFLPKKQQRALLAARERFLLARKIIAKARSVEHWRKSKQPYAKTYFDRELFVLGRLWEEARLRTNLRKSGSRKRRPNDKKIESYKPLADMFNDLTTNKSMSKRSRWKYIAGAFHLTIDQVRCRLETYERDKNPSIQK